MGKIVVVDAVRSAVGRAKKGSLANRRPDELAGEVIRMLMARNPKVDPATVEDLVLGCAFPEGEQGMNVARMVGRLGGLPENSSGMTINRFCSSGLQAIALAAGSVKAGFDDVVIAGGMESMTMVPMTGNKPSASPEVMEQYPATYTPMGITAENVATRFNISRQQQDEFAVRSHELALAAIERGAFENEIVPVHGVKFDASGERQMFEFKVDEMPRPGTTVESLSKLRPVFAAKGSVTAGNASPLSDGAAAAIVMKQKRAKELAGQERPHDRRHRRLRSQRGVRQPSRLRPATARHPRQQAERQRWRHRPRPPPGLHRRQAHSHRPQRAKTPRRQTSYRHDVHRRRHGRRRPIRSHQLTRAR